MDQPAGPAAPRPRFALVTGGTGGLGVAICRRLADAGFTVAALHTHGHADIEGWRARQEADGYRFHTQPVEVADFDSCHAAVAALRARAGPVSVLVNNAGVTRDVTLLKMSPHDWQRVLRVNLDSAFNMTRQVLEDMVAQRWGRVVSISSVNAHRGSFGQCNYAASKAGLHGFTRSLALELAGKGITVNTVSPGFLRTPLVEQVPELVMRERILPQIPLARLGEPAEIAEVVAYLASERSAFVTGADFAINGGQHMP